jgi:hypothetical protein
MAVISNAPGKVFAMESRTAFDCWESASAEMVTEPNLHRQKQRDRQTFQKVRVQVF